MFMYIQELFLKKNSVSLKIESGDLNCKWSNIDIGVDETLPNFFFFEFEQTKLPWFVKDKSYN
jgi:hypothetical protein